MESISVIDVDKGIVYRIEQWKVKAKKSHSSEEELR